MSNFTVKKLPSDITVVVTCLNEAATIERLLDGLSHQTVRPEQVILVDGGSSDQTVDLAKNWGKHQPELNLKIMLCPGNRSQSRNAGVAAAKTNLLAFTDAGCVPEPGWLAALLDQAHQLITQTPSPVWPVVAGYYRGVAETPFEAAVIPYALVMPDRVDPAHFLPATRSMLVHRQALQAAGGFPEHLSDNEDYWLARRWETLARQSESKIVMGFTDQAVVAWWPRSTLRSFWTMIFRFARGDAAAGLWRPKVGLIFGRYLVAGGLLTWSGLNQSWMVTTAWVLGGLIGYTLWAIAKSRRYVGSGWMWLPILQVVSDWAVIVGSVHGWLKKGGT